MKKLAGLFIVIFVLAGCATQPQVKVKRYTTESFKPTIAIEIFRTKPVGRDYIEIGEVSILLRKSTEENAVAYLIEKSKELGADAIIVMGERSKAIIFTESIAVPIKELYGVAIRYK